MTHQNLPPPRSTNPSSVSPITFLPIPNQRWKKGSAGVRLAMLRFAGIGYIVKES